jgi:2-polyprenyl-6-methoxyphenol hydroxylase-like FAD-dependent oxidoreductase
LASHSGGGIGGLTLALALTPYADIVIDIYEAAARFEDIGAGLGIWGRGIGVLRKMGLEKGIRAIATAAPGKNEGEPSPTNFMVFCICEDQTKALTVLYRRRPV